jgi:hypothetical protein
VLCTTTTAAAAAAAAVVHATDIYDYIYYSSLVVERALILDTVLLVSLVVMLHTLKWLCLLWRTHCMRYVYGYSNQRLHCCCQFAVLCSSAVPNSLHNSQRVCIYYKAPLLTSARMYIVYLNCTIRLSTYKSLLYMYYCMMCLYDCRLL